MKVTVHNLPPTTMKLKARWKVEVAQDLNAYHSLDAEDQLVLKSIRFAKGVEPRVGDLLKVLKYDVLFAHGVDGEDRFERISAVYLGFTHRETLGNERYIHTLMGPDGPIRAYPIEDPTMYHPELIVEEVLVPYASTEDQA